MKIVDTSFKEGANILHQIFRFSGGVDISCRINQSKSWYSLEPSQTSKVDFFAEIVFGLSQFFCASLQLRCFIGSIRRFQKALYALLEMILHLEKKRGASTPLCLTLLFQRNVIDSKWVELAERWIIIKRGK